MIQSMLDCGKPIVCGLNGTAAGVWLRTSCSPPTSLLAVEHATIIEIFARRGPIPDGGAAYLLASSTPAEHRVAAGVLRRGDDHERRGSGSGS